MDLVTIFFVQLALTLVVYALLARWYLAPWLRTQPMATALVVLIAPHTLRHLGLAFLVPGLTSDAVPTGFANAAAYGDVISGLLALLALLAVRGNWRAATPVVWTFSVFGLGDLIYALSHAGAIPHLGTAWLIPTFVVPGLIVTHWMVIARIAGPAGHRPGLDAEHPRPLPPTAPSSA